MVAGDVIGARTSGALTFQPAAGVECMVSTFSPNDAALYFIMKIRGRIKMQMLKFSLVILFG